MRRSVPFVTCLCLFVLATGLTLMALAKEVNRGPISGHDRTTETAAANVELVRRFYSDVAVVLATGDAALLDASIAPDLAEHPVRPGALSGRDGFVRALLALRVTFPGLKLVVDDVLAAGKDQVLARVHIEGAESGAFLGRPAPASIGRWGPLEVWRISDGALVERWGDLDPAVLLPLGQAPVSVDALGPGRRRVIVTRMTIEPGAKLPVNNGQAIRVFAVEVGTLTVDVGSRSKGTVAVARGSALPVVSGPGTSIAVLAGDRVVTAPEVDYTLTNSGKTPAIALVVIVSNTLGGEWPQTSSAAAASWTVAVMPEALGGALPSPAGVSARVLVDDVEVAFPDQPILALGWMFLGSGAALALPAGDGTLIAAVDAGWVDLTVTDGTPRAMLASGEWTVIPVGVGSMWQAGDGVAVVLVLTVGQDDSTQWATPKSAPLSTRSGSPIVLHNIDFSFR